MVRKACEDVQTAGGKRKLNVPVELPGERIGQGFAPRLVMRPHPTQMPGEMAFGHECRDDGLLETGCAAMEPPAEPARSLDESGREDQIAQAQAGKQRLAETARIKDGLAAGKAFQ